MFDIPRTTHRYLVQPITEVPHIKTILIRRFLSFLHQLQNCPKQIVGNLLNLIKYDVNSTTGANLKQISILCGINTNDLNISDANLIEYFPISDDEKWRIGILRDIIDARKSNSTIEGFTFEELDLIVDYVCTS